jgi:hypothetical protein
MDKNMMNVLIVLIIAIVIIIILSLLWMYTPYMGGYHGIPSNHMGNNMMRY